MPAYTSFILTFVFLITYSPQESKASSFRGPNLDLLHAACNKKNLVILIEIQGAQWLETATCERGFSLRTQILTAQRYSMGDSLLACLIMIVSNDLSLDQKEEVVKFFLADLRLSRRGCHRSLL
jgi:hypothetical protein